MKHARGFTLIELAIVLVIMTILIGGLAVPLSAQIQARRVAETRADMRAIQAALIGYAMSHTTAVDLDGDGTSETIRHFLPCPDDGTGAQAGDEGARITGTFLCSSIRGMLPWRTLGVNDADAWGQRYTYAVTAGFADGKGFISVPTPTATPPTTPTSGTLNVHASANCVGAGVANLAAAVVVSHGPNGRGAQNRGGGTPLAPAAVPADERQNLPAYASVAPCNVANTDFVSRTPDANFDDLVVWLSPGTLFSRVCPDGGCL